jgi:hypothetical protein
MGKVLIIQLKTNQTMEKFTTIKNPRQQAQNAGFITLFAGLAVMLLSMWQAHQAMLIEDYALRENFLCVFIWSSIIMLFSFLTIYTNRAK